MRVRSGNKKAKNGNVLVVCLVVVCLFGVFLYSYLYLARAQRGLVARSQSWNSALSLAEAGVEEALAQLNPGAPAPVIDRTANGWGSASGGLYGPKSRTNSAGTYAVMYDDGTFPTIYATGYVSVPSIPATLERAICVTTTNRSLFGAALVAKFNIDLKGNGVATDSFNSRDSNLSVNGMYDPNRTSTNGDIASVGGLVNVANADLDGKLLLGATATDTIGSNGTISGGVHNDFNVELQDVVLPQTTWLPVTASPETITTTTYTNTYDYVFRGSGGDYQITGLNGSIYVNSNTAVRLLVSGNANAGVITVDGTGSLVLYMDGANLSLGGSSGIGGMNATNFTYFGTTNNTSINFSGNAALTGTIYAPEATLKMSGGGSGVYDIVGSIVVNDAVINGHFNFHYDENLLLSGYKTGFIAASWREL